MLMLGRLAIALVGLPKILLKQCDAMLKRALQFRNGPQHVNFAGCATVLETDAPFRPVRANVLQLLSLVAQCQDLFAIGPIGPLYLLAQSTMMSSEHGEGAIGFGQRFERGLHAAHGGAVELDLFTDVPVQRAGDFPLEPLRDIILEARRTRD